MPVLWKLSWHLYSVFCFALFCYVLFFEGGDYTLSIRLASKSWNQQSSSLSLWSSWGYWHTPPLPPYIQFDNLIFCVNMSQCYQSLPHCSHKDSRDGNRLYKAELHHVCRAEQSTTLRKLSRVFTGKRRLGKGTLGLGGSGHWLAPGLLGRNGSEFIYG